MASASPRAVDVQSLPAAGKLQYLRDHMQRPERNPAQVLCCATHVLSHGSVSEAERCAISELAVMAAIDLGQDEQATQLLRPLLHKFGAKSVRVRRLLGMQLEAAGKSQSAVELYRSILKEHPTEQWCGRRLCAIMRGQGEYKRAIEVLKSTEIYADPKEKDKQFTYAQMYPTDEAAARQLISLYWLTNNVSECIRYADEVVLFDPANFQHHTRVAELCAVNGQLERAATAYAQSLRLNDERNNVRAMYGLWHVATRMASAKYKGTPGSAVVADAAALVEFAATKLRDHYGPCTTASYLDLTLKSE